MRPFNIFDAFGAIRGVGSGARWPSDAFVMTVATSSDGQTFEFEMNATGGTIDCTIDWGDGTSSAITAYNDTNLSHAYATAGNHQIILRGSWTAPYFNGSADALLVTSIDQWGSNYGTLWRRSLNGCRNLITIDGNSFGAGVTDMSQMFYHCNSFPGSLTMIDGWDMSDVTDLTDFLSLCVGFSQTNYDALLISLQSKGLAGDLNSGLTFGGPPCHYTAGGDAEAAHDYLTGTLGWTITDGGPA